MAKEKLTARNAVTTADSDSYIHVVKDNISYKIKKSDFQKELASGYRGKLAIADTPSADGYYMATETGTYTNAGSLVTDLSLGVNYINVSSTQTVFGLSVITQSIAVIGEIEAQNEEAVTGAKIKSYSDHNLEIESLSANKHDVSKVITGYTINVVSDSTLKPDANANGRISGFVPVEPSTTYILYGFPNFQDKDRVLAYDDGVDPENDAATSVISTTRGNGGAGDWYNFTTTANTKYIQFSHGTTLAADITGVVIAVGGDDADNKIPFESFVPFITKHGYWENLTVSQIQDNVLRKVNKSANLFNTSNILEEYRLETDGTITAGVSTNSTVNYTEIEESTDYVLWYLDQLSTRRLSFYDSDKNYISNINLATGGDYVYLSGTNTIFSTVIQHKFTSPANAVYIRYTLHTQSDFTVNINTHKLFKLIDYDCVFDEDEQARYETEYKNVKSAIRTTTKQFVELSDKNVLVFGDSISANSLGYGGWCDQFHSLMMPKNWYNYAVGGSTLTDTSGEFGADYITLGDNSLIAAAEQYISDYNALSVEAADVVMIYGGINDYDKTLPDRYVTSSEYTGSDYNEYLEDNFFTSSSTNQLLDLSTIDRGKAIGALRYIVERLGEELPNAKFFILTPPQTLLHDWRNQRKLVYEVIWTAHRMSIPCIDVWGDCGLPLLSWEYPSVGDPRYIEDTVHDYDTEAGDIRGRFIVNEFINKYQFFDSSF